MKKVILASLVAVSSMAMADEYVGATVGQSRTTGGEQTATYGSVTLGKTFGAFDVEGRVGATRTTETNDNSKLVELRTRYNVAGFGQFKPWALATIGEQLNPGYSYGYYAGEVGLGYTFTPALRGDVSVSRSLAFSNADSALTAYAVGVSYAVNKKNSVNVAFVKSVAQVNSSSVEVGFQRSF